MIETPIPVYRLNETEVAYQRAAEIAIQRVREAGVPMVVKCTPNGMVYLDSIHNGSSPKLTIVTIDPRPSNRPAYREDHLEQDLRDHATRNGIDSGVRYGRFRGGR